MSVYTKGAPFAVDSKSFGLRDKLNVELAAIAVSYSVQDPMSLVYCSNQLNFPSSLELSREFQEECYSIALHPSGLYILVGFSDKLRLMNLLIDEIRTFKEFTIRGCREVNIIHY